MRAARGSLLCLRRQLNASALFQDERNGAAQEGVAAFCEHHCAYRTKGRPFNEATPYGERSHLRCNGDVMEGRGDGFKRLNLRRSIDHSCKCSQHFWVSFGVVSIGAA